MDKEKKEARFDDRQMEGQTGYQPALVLFARLSGWIGGPVIVALFVGKKLDEKFSSEPWGFLACVGAAFILSSVGIVWEAQKAIREIEKAGSRNSKKNSK